MPSAVRHSNERDKTGRGQSRWLCAEQSHFGVLEYSISYIIMYSSTAAALGFARSDAHASHNQRAINNSTAESRASDNENNRRRPLHLRGPVIPCSIRVCRVYIIQGIHSTKKPPPVKR